MSANRALNKRKIALAGGGHGWNDPALSAYSTIEQYKSVKALEPEIMDYMRQFLLHGVLHCGGGNGAAQVDCIALTCDWVENNKAPERVILSKNIGGKEVLTRPVFPFRAEAVYDSKGDPDKKWCFITE